jgi:hypothetical protein
MKQPLLEITWGSDGVDYVIHVNTMDRFLDPGAPYDPKSEERRALQVKRRRELTCELRALARAIETGSSPFTNYESPDHFEARGDAEREIDTLAEHIIRLASGVDA